MESLPELSPELFHRLSIFDFAQVGAGYIKLPELVFKWTNQAFAQMLGYTPSELLGKRLADLCHPEDLEETRKNMAKVGEGQLVMGRVDRRYRHKDGHYVWFNITASVHRDAEGIPREILGIVIDVTERKRQETELREKEARLRQVLELGRIGIWDFDLKANVAIWSPELRELLGVPPDFPATPAAFRSFVLPEDKPFYDQSATELANHVRRDFPPFRIRRPDGTVRWLQNVGQIVEVSESRLMGTIVDVTEVRRFEEIIEAQRARMVAASKMSALGEMAGALAHEINNPLAIIHGNAKVLQQLAESGRLDSDVAAKTAETIASTAERISKITKSLRAFARNAEQDPFEVVDLANVIKETAEFCQERFKMLGVQFKLDAADSDLRAECRPVQVSQVLLNLLNNACDAVEAQPRKEIAVAAKPAGEAVEITVSDSGPGISAEVAGRIFQPFFTTKEVGRGTGLGLSVAKGIVESHSGSLSFEQLPTGTAFKMLLPKRHPTSSWKR